jgi:hypothetical protein
VQEEQLTAIALAIYRRFQKNAGMSKPEADASWQALGPEGRGAWRLVAKAAVEAMAPAPQLERRARRGFAVRDR